MFRAVRSVSQRCLSSETGEFIKTNTGAKNLTRERCPGEARGRRGQYRSLHTSELRHEGTGGGEEGTVGGVERTGGGQGGTGGGRHLNQPVTATMMPRPGGIASFMRLPIQKDTEGLDACFVGIPLDTGTSNRSGARYGPRHLRSESPMRPFNQGTGVNPFLSLNVADIGDVFVTMYDLPEACRQIKRQYSDIVKTGCIPLTMGGDHTISYPILQAMKEKYGPVGLIHVDAHPDLQDEVLGSRIGHGTPFKRAYDEGLLACERVVQIGLRGTALSENDCNIGRSLGFRVVGVEECWYRSLTPLMQEIRQQMADGPVYLSFDIDSIDPSYCPGTGTPEIGGLTTIQAMEIIRGCKGLNLVGCDLVEVSPPYDHTGTTAFTGAHLLFEMLCVLPGVR